MRPVTRRTLLAVAGVGAAAVSMPALALGARPGLAVYDSRLPEAVTFARDCAAKGMRLLDVAEEDAALWRTSRRGFGVTASDEIVGLTGWSDWVALRGLLHEQRRSIRSERRIDAGGRTLFAWAAA